MSCHKDSSIYLRSIKQYHGKNDADKDETTQIACHKFFTYFNHFEKGNTLVKRI